MRLEESNTLFFQENLFENHLSHLDNLPLEEGWAQGLLLKDEWANSLTHGIGLFLSIIGFIFLLIHPLQEGHHWRSLTFGIYGLSLILLYAASTFYHTIKNPKLKKTFRTIDHCAIYLMIAGSYTPVTLLLLQGVWGWTLFALIWALTFIGIIFKIFFKHRFPLFSVALYLGMGWLVVIAIKPLINHFHYEGLCWLIAGGLCYTSGIFFYLLDTRRFYHAIWHLFVLGGSTCHYFAIFLYL